MSWQLLPFPWGLVLMIHLWAVSGLQQLAHVKQTGLGVRFENMRPSAADAVVFAVYISTFLFQHGFVGTRSGSKTNEITIAIDSIWMNTATGKQTFFAYYYIEIFSDQQSTSIQQKLRGDLGLTEGFHRSHPLNRTIRLRRTTREISRFGRWVWTISRGFDSCFHYVSKEKKLGTGTLDEVISYKRGSFLGVVDRAGLVLLISEVLIGLGISIKIFFFGEMSLDWQETASRTAHWSQKQAFLEGRVGVEVLKLKWLLRRT